MAWDRRVSIASICWVIGSWVVACSGSAFRADEGTPNGGAPDEVGGQAGKSTTAGTKSGGTGSSSMSGSSAMGGGPSIAPEGGAPASGAPGSGEAGTTDVGGTLAAISSDALVYWFKADAGVVETDGAISKWLDQSGNGRHATQQLAEQRPTLAHTDLLPLPVLELDGQNDFLELLDIDPPLNQGLTFFAIAGRSRESECSAIVELSNEPEQDDVFFGSDHTSFQFEVFDQTLKSTPDVFPTGQIRLVEALQTADPVAPNAELRVNGAFVGSMGMPAPVKVLRVNNFIGKSQYQYCTPFPGAIAEIILYGRALAEAERIAVETYLKTKWGCCQ